MDVTCEHCGTEYEFDDALVSARGTTVQCTHCGYRFRVRAGDPTEDVWRVRTKQGAILEFTSLQKLQEALLRNEIGATDELTRGRSDRGRLLGSIPELEGFLAGDPVLSATTTRRSASLAPLEPPATLASPTDDRGAGPPAAPKRTITLRPDVSVPPPSSSTGGTPSLAILGTPEATRLPPVALRELVRAADSADPSLPSEEARTMRRPSAPRSDLDVGSPEPPLLSSPLPPIARTPVGIDRDMLAGADVASGESGHPPASRRPGRVSGAVVAVVGMAAIAAGTVAWFRFQDTARGPGASPASTASSDSVQSAVFASVETALVLDDAHGALLALQRLPMADQSSPHGRILAARAQLRKADARWFVAELATDLSARAAARSLFEPALATATDSVEKLPKDGPLAQTAAVLKADLLRMRGERDAARRLLKSLGAEEPDDLDYVRGVLESSDAQPDVATAMKYLRSAAAREPKPGRATAMMAFVFARAGDARGARIELDRISARPEETDRVAALRVFMTRFDALDGGADDGGATVTAEDAGRGAGALPDDPRRMLAEASSALQRGDSARARVLYQAALDKNPTDSEALAGLGDVARGVGDIVRAKEYYQKAVAANASFLPALIALADIQWDAGDRAAAGRTYQDIFDRIPEGAYPPRVRERRTGGGASTPTPTSIPTPIPTPAPTPLPTATSTSTVSPEDP